MDHHSWSRSPGTNKQKMKQVLVVCALISAVLSDAPNAAPYGQQNNYNPNNNVPILRLENNNNGEGGYNYAYETGDGTAAQEQGYLKDADSPSAQGSFVFTAPDGQQFSIQYTADENGFVPQGAHIPTPPPIPEEILKGLEQNRADEARGIIDDGQYHPEPAPQQQYNNARNNQGNAYNY